MEASPTRPFVVAVIGSRTLAATAYPALCQVLDQLALTTPIDGLVSGGAKTGADAMAERYAAEFGLPIEIIRPRYAEFGRRAPLLRNVEIIERAACVVAAHLHNSRGTAHALRESRKRGKPILLVAV